LETELPQKIHTDVVGYTICFVLFVFSLVFGQRTRVQCLGYSIVNRTLYLATDGYILKVEKLQRIKKGLLIRLSGPIFHFQTTKKHSQRGECVMYRLFTDYLNANVISNILFWIC